MTNKRDPQVLAWLEANCHHCPDCRRDFGRFYWRMPKHNRPVSGRPCGVTLSQRTVSIHELPAVPRGAEFDVAPQYVGNETSAGLPSLGKRR